MGRLVNAVILCVVGLIALSGCPACSQETGSENVSSILQCDKEKQLILLAGNARPNVDHGPSIIELEDEEDVDDTIAQLYEAGQYAQAIPLARKRLKEMEEKNGASDLSVARAANNLAWLLQAQGEYAEARLLFERALKLDEELFGPNHAEVAVALNNLASLLCFQGDRDSARPLYERALKINEEVYGHDHAAVAESLNNLAVLLDAEGMRTEALSLYERALMISEKTLGADHPDLAIGLNNLATIYGAKGDLVTAKQLLERVLKIREKALGENHPDIAETLNNLAMIYKAQGNLASAKVLLMKALTIYQAVSGPNHLDVAVSLNNLAEVDSLMKDLSAAQDLVIRAAEIVDTHIKSIVPTLSMAEQRVFLNTWLPGEIGRLLSFCHEGQPLKRAYSLIFRWKGLLIDSLRRQTELTNAVSKDPVLEADVERLQQVRNEIAGWYQQSRSMSQAAWEKKNVELSKHKELLERSLARSVKSGTLEDVLSQLDLPGFQAYLADDEALIDIYAYHDVVANAPSNECYAAILIGSKGELNYVDLGSAYKVNSLISSWRADVLARRSDLASFNSLVETLWKPVVNNLPDQARRLWLCPDGELVRIPWHILVEQSDNHAPWSISEVDSPRELVQLAKSNVTEPTKEKSLLVIGGIDFGAASGGSELRNLFKPLPATLNEANAISKLAASAKMVVEEITGAQATKEVVLKNLPHFMYCHLATHGVFFNEEEATKLQGKQKGSVTRNPLVESGIALAGANCGGQVGGSGILTAEELVGLNLSCVELVTLSACETGRGREITGQGVMGLRASTMAAGAKAILMSLWKVPDQPTQKLMEAFYDNLWIKKLSKLEALRQAQLAVKNEPYDRYKEPINWAAWILVGKGW